MILRPFDSSLRNLTRYILIKIKVAVTSNFLAKRSSIRESSFVLTQANYRKFQRIIKRKWNKRIFLISNLQFLIHFLLSLLSSHKNEMLVLWLAFNYITLQRNHRSGRSQMLFWIGVLKNFVRACNFIKKKLQRKCFPVKLEKLRALFLQNTSGGRFRNYFRWLLLF